MAIYLTAYIYKTDLICTSPYYNISSLFLYRIISETNFGPSVVMFLSDSVQDKKLFAVFSLSLEAGSSVGCVLCFFAVWPDYPFQGVYLIAVLCDFLQHNQLVTAFLFCLQCDDFITLFCVSVTAR
jgi:hypothetical protein